MTTTVNKSNKSLSSSCYGTLHYTYYNPSSIYNKHFNIQKRQRSKDSYVEIAKEKRNFISYEVVQIQKYTERNKSKTIFSSTQSCPRFNNKNIKNKIIDKEKLNDIIINNINSNEKGENYEVEKIEITPYTTSLRNFSRIINNDKINNLVKNSKKIINKRKRNFIGSYKISNKIREIFKSKYSNNHINNNFSTYKNEIDKNKEDNSGNICLGKISVETYTFKDKNSNNNNYIDKISSENKKENINSDEQKNLLENKENININNQNKENIPFTKKMVNKKLNHEEEKNEEINKKTQETCNKTQSENKIYQTLKEMKEYLESIKSSLIKPYKEKPNKPHNTKHIIYKNKNNNINNNNNKYIKKRITKPSSCPKVINSNKYSTEIKQNVSLKENINKILQKNKELNKTQKNFFTKKDKRKNNSIIMYSQFLSNNDEDDNEDKLKELLKKIPNNKRNKRNKDVMHLKYYEIKTFNNDNVKNKKKIRNKNKNNISSIMPPNNLKEIILKERMKFLFK